MMKIFLTFALLTNLVYAQKVPSKTTLVETGADRTELYLPLLRGKSVGIFANQTSVIGKTHLVDSLLKKHIAIRKIFAPEHGFRGMADAGEKVSNMKDPVTGIPIISLYGNKTKPSAEDLKDIDILVFDIQDVGVRFYTYISSLQKFVEAAIENNRPMIILDRPNPNGFYVDGPVLDTSFRSFVGMQPVPVVYGMTIGEYAKMIVGEKWLNPALSSDLNTIYAIDDAEKTLDSMIKKLHGDQIDFGTSGFQLLVIPCKNYTHNTKYILPTRPSPNLPDMQAIYLYPSLCFFEGTSVSLGRGTDKPFQQFGSPIFPKTNYQFTPRSVEGAKNPPLLNQVCNGFNLSSDPVALGMENRMQLKWLIKAYSLFPDKDNFFLESGFFNKLAGSDHLKNQIKEGKSEAEIRKSWEPALSQFKATRKKYLLYPDFK
ncbi:MAG: DUF1343 domain-containing protein [Bacteroidetes bacterium]|nr:MAG: DUF1343 domain-containing protein [Bacteroidota bacterium]